MSTSSVAMAEAAGRGAASALGGEGRRASLPRRAARPDLRRADLLGDHLPVPDLLDDHDLVQGGARRDAGPSRALGGLQAELARLALARPFARHDLQDLDGARGVPEALHEQRHHLAQRLGAGGDARVARRLWAEPLLLPLPVDAQQRHLVLLPVAAHPAAGGARDAVPRPLQGAGAARHADRHHPDLHADR